MNNKPIGVFDSGVGGLSVLKKLKEELPNENYIYFGDTARIPYGEKTEEELFEIIKEILDFYKYKNVKAVVTACNTGTAAMASDIKKDYDFPIFGLIEPAAEYAAYSNADKIGVICTTATAALKAYGKAINKLNPDIEVIETACPGLVEIVENNKIDTYEAKKLVLKYITPLLEKNIKKIILGCTHYPYLRKIINDVTLDNEILIDPADYLAYKLTDDLMFLNNSTEDGIVDFYVSSDPAKFEEVGRTIYADCKNVQEIDIRSILSI